MIFQISLLLGLFFYVKSEVQAQLLTQKLSFKFCSLKYSFWGMRKAKNLAWSLMRRLQMRRTRMWRCLMQKWVKTPFSTFNNYIWTFFYFQFLKYAGYIYWKWGTIKCYTSRRYTFLKMEIDFMIDRFLILTFLDTHLLMIVHLRSPLFWQGNTNDWNLWFGRCVDPQGKECRFRTLCWLGQARKWLVSFRMNSHLH